MKLTNKDKELVNIARGILNPKKLYGGESGTTSCALRTKKGKIFTGISLDLFCGIGFCAEHSAISNMISHSREIEIEAIVAVQKRRPIAPCGRCRELIKLINKKNLKNTWIIISNNKKSKLNTLLPKDWIR